MAIIRFQIDSTKLPKGGSSITAPVGVGHPPFLLNGTQQAAEYQVPIKGGENVRIYTDDASRSQNVKLAPCGIIAHSFKQESLTPAIMKDPKLRPIDVPNFNMENGTSPDFIEYVDNDNPQWGSSPGNWQNWPNNPFISDDVRANSVPTYTPFSTFNGSSIVSGLLQYGLVFALTRDGKSVEYFYFDPYLNINA